MDNSFIEIEEFHERRGENRSGPEDFFFEERWRGGRIGSGLLFFVSEWNTSRRFFNIIGWICYSNFLQFFEL